MTVLAITPQWRPLITAVLVVVISCTSVAGQQNKVKQVQHVKQTNKTNVERVEMVCPEFSARQTTFLTLPCTRQTDCLFGDLCCTSKPGSKKKRCYQGVPKPLPEQPHQPLFGMIPLTCPNPPVAELLAVVKCENDTDCWPRVCCPDGRQRFCRTPAPHWEKIPQNQQLPVLRMLRTAMKYFQCSDRPEPIFDLFPRTCQSPRDCFPDLCCQEGSKKVCRRARSSILALFTSFTTPITTARKQVEPKQESKVSQAPIFFLPSWTLTPMYSTTIAPRRKSKSKQPSKAQVIPNNDSGIELI